MDLADDCAGGDGTSYRPANRDCAGSGGIKAWNTPNELDTEIAASNLIYVRQGTYTSVDDLRFSPTPAVDPANEGERITYKLYPGDSAFTLKGDPKDSSFVGLGVNDHYYTFEGLNFEEFPTGIAFWIGGDYNVLKDITADKCLTTSCWAFISPDATGTVIDGGTFNNAGYYSGQTAVYAEGIKVQGTSTLIQNSYFGNATHASILPGYNTDFYTVFRNNVYENTWRHSLNLYFAGQWGISYFLV
ncbi:unnamed protein product, partial [marine sediment metagenome]